MAIQLRLNHRLLRPNPNPNHYIYRFLSTKPSGPHPRESPSESPSSSSNSSLFDDIRNNLKGYRRSDPTSPSPPPQKTPFTFYDLYKRNAADGPSESPDQARTSFDAIRESLRDMRKQGGMNSPPPMPPRRSGMNPSVIGGGDGFSFSLFGEQKSGDGEKDGDGEKKIELLKSYTHVELGERLKQLRPVKKVMEEEGGGGSWFSLSELSERVVKLRELEEKESAEKRRGGNVSFDHLRKSLEKLKTAETDRSQESLAQRLNILDMGKKTQDLGPPKDVLLEKYFHPDNMSAAEKMKLRLDAVKEEFKVHESDCGSARFQVAVLTEKIKYLSTTLHKKDKHSRKGLMAMVQKRRKLLKYLQRTDWDSYTLVISKLGLKPL